MGKVSAGGGAKLQLTTSKQQYRFAGKLKSIVNKTTPNDTAKSDIFAFSDVEKIALQRDTLEALLLSQGVPITALSQEELDFLIEFITIDDRGAAYTYLSGPMMDTAIVTAQNLQDPNFTKEQAIARLQEQLYNYPTIYWKENGTLQFQIANDQNNLEHMLEAVALYHIRQIPEEAYLGKDLTFEAYGVPWFNLPQYKSMMSQPVVEGDQQDYLEFIKLTNYIFDNSQTTYREYLMEEWIAASYQSTEYMLTQPQGSVVTGQVHTLSPLFQKYSDLHSQLAKSMMTDANGNTIRVSSPEYRELLAERNHLLTVSGILIGITDNASSLSAVDIVPHNIRNFNDRLAVKAWLAQKPMIDMTLLPNLQGGTNYHFKMAKEFDNSKLLSTAKKERQFFVFAPTDQFDDSMLEAMKKNLEDNYKDPTKEAAKTALKGTIEVMGGDTLSKITDLPETVLTELLGSAKAAKWLTTVPLDTIKSFNEANEHNVFLNQLIGHISFEEYAKALLLSGQFNLNADGTTSFPILYQDTAQLNYNLYKYQQEMKKRGITEERITADTLWNAKTNLRTEPKDSYLARYESWSGERYGLLGEEWGAINEKIETYNRTLKNNGLAKHQKDIEQMTPEEIDAFLEQYPEFATKNDIGFITEADLIP